MRSTSARRIVLLGSTGSIGRQTLEVLRRFPGEFELVGLAANRQADQLYRQIDEFRPGFAALADERAAEREDLDAAALRLGTRLFSGPEALVDLVRAAEADLVVVATVGIAGLLPTLAALESGAGVALANKEVLVCAGELVCRTAKDSGAKVLPIDSEHNAVFQCLDGRPIKSVKRIVLTASGGPFRTTPPHELAAVTRGQALAHPNWHMGEKITIDSATMMNKGFEVIEAHWLFGLPLDRIDVVIHPQSCIHSMVEFIDGSVLAQLGPADMRLPIQHCLFHPDRRSSAVSPLDLVSLGRLDFEAVDAARFPCLELARESLRRGGTAPAVLNAANEVAVGLFLEEKIDFLSIPHLIEQALEAHRNRGGTPALEEVLEADAWAREHARSTCLSS